MMGKLITLIIFPLLFLKGLGMVLGTLFVPRRPQQVEAPQQGQVDGTGVDYDSMVGQPTAEYLGGFEPVFCPRCHVLVAYTRETTQGVEIAQNGRKVITIGNNVTVNSNGKEEKGFPIKCPNGHTVMIYPRTEVKA